MQRTIPEVAFPDIVALSADAAEAAFADSLSAVQADNLEAVF
jgi:hypothetical protein